MLVSTAVIIRLRTRAHAFLRSYQESLSFQTSRHRFQFLDTYQTHPSVEQRA